MADEVNLYIADYNATLADMIDEKAQVNKDEELLG